MGAIGRPYIFFMQVFNFEYLFKGYEIMKLNRIGANETVLSFDNGTEVLFSYDTPVAGRRFIDGDLQIFKTSKKWSVTTTKHVNKYLRTFNAKAVELPQCKIDNFAQNYTGE